MTTCFRLTAASLLLLCSPSSYSQKPVSPSDAAPVASAKPPAERAWDLLSETASTNSHAEQRIQALAALGTMSSDQRAHAVIAKCMTDRDIDVRTAAVLAGGETKSLRLIPDLRKALDDPDPGVAFTAAVTLWKLHDHSGEDLLLAVVSGERRGNAGLMKGAGHGASRMLHNPAALAKLGATQGAGMLLGPFGIGITALEYARRNGGDGARAVAIAQLAEQHVDPVHQELISALTDKDPVVRAAASRALGDWNDTATVNALVPLLDDSKLPVRLDAAAGLLRASAPASSTRSSRKAPSRR